jgi:hypothetical protein
VDLKLSVLDYIWISESIIKSRVTTTVYGKRWCTMIIRQQDLKCIIRKNGGDKRMKMQRYKIIMIKTLNKNTKNESI